MNERSRKVLKAFAILLALSIVAYIAQEIGYLRGRAAMITKISPGVATLILSASSKDLSSGKVALVDDDVAKALAERNTTVGIPTRIEVRKTMTTPFGIPTVVDLDVTRGGKSYRETLYFHGYYVVGSYSSE